MARRKRRQPTRFRVGRVTVYFHHGAWWFYYREHGRPVRCTAAEARGEAEQLAAQVNAQLSTGSPTLLAFTSITIPELRQQFLEYHEHVLKSSLGTVQRYRAATQHLETFALQHGQSPPAHAIRPEAFAAYLRRIDVAPNGHAHSAKRKLRDKGVRFILETCRAMFTYAFKQRHLPPYAGNPFAALPLDHLKIEDAKPIFVFTADTELTFFRATSRSAFPIHFVLAKTGLRVGELTHLLIEELDLAGGWLYVRNKPGLAWRIKTGSERVVPLLPEVVAVFRHVIGSRAAGPVFLRERFTPNVPPKLVGDLAALERVCVERQAAAEVPPSRHEVLRIACTVWRDAGAIKADAVRCSFVRVMKAIGLPRASCPKSWRHSFATLL
ncbi:MAG: tyrosine-type recombinase/integrase [Planctomycetia bacterium]|nr:tyrosine-type recombinase/integrase [Planctomycetia bacterium]